MKKLWITIILTLLILGGGAWGTWWKLGEQKRLVAYFDKIELTKMHGVGKLMTKPMFPGWFEDEFVLITMLRLDSAQVNDEDLKLISSLTSLTVLYLGSGQVKDLSPLSSLTSLTKLDLKKTQVKDLRPLSSLTSLTVLGLGGTQVTDLTPLLSLTSLTTLYFWETKITDLTLISTLTSLTELYLSGTQITDITPLSSLTSLIKLDLWGTKVTKKEIVKLQKALPHCKIVSP